MKLFLDTNVLASALMSHGLCREFLNRALINHTVIIGDPVRDELHRVLTTKFRVPPSLWKQLATKLKKLERAPASNTRLNHPIPDPDDIPILACALAAGAELFITGDKALLELGEVEGMPVVSPREAWGRIQSTP